MSSPAGDPDSNWGPLPEVLPGDLYRAEDFDRYCQKRIEDLTRQPAPPGCNYVGELAHGPVLVTLEFGCEHEHTGEEQTCEVHLRQLRVAHRAGQELHCYQCGHSCLAVYRVKETGEEFRFNA